MASFQQYTQVGQLKSAKLMFWSSELYWVVFSLIILFCLWPYAV